MTNTSKHIFIVSLLMSLWCTSVQAEPFARFLVNFLRTPEKQAQSAHNALTVDGKKAKRNGNYMLYNDKASVAMLCADSISIAAPSKADVQVSLVNQSTKESGSFTFAHSGRSFVLKEVENGKPMVDNDFLSFLSEFSRNNDFQIKRTIFPLPIRQFRNGKEASNNLLMPRDWSYMNFTAKWPQICVFSNVENSNNRRLYIYKGEHVSQIYNFISINRKWYLIEVENY
ncbi:MAG: hypothetical protein MJZ23_05145 [Paludibacteraceae bacterium]|nr:hypothetical protein [Paludibacteraceae bacterium]